MRLLLIIITLSFVLVSCSHMHKTNPTNKKNIVEVSLSDSDSDHEPKIGQSVKVFNMVLKSYHRSSKNEERRGYVKEHEVQGKIVEVVSKKIIRVELEDDFEVTEKTYAQY